MRRFFTLALLLCAAFAAARQPNVVLILIDDLGWRDPGFVGHRYTATRNTPQPPRHGALF